MLKGLEIVPTAALHQLFTVVVKCGPTERLGPGG